VSEKNKKKLDEINAKIRDLKKSRQILFPEIPQPEVQELPQFLGWAQWLELFKELDAKETLKSRILI
jgi:hypothetical protein